MFYMLYHLRFCMLRHMPRKPLFHFQATIVTKITTQFNVYCIKYTCCKIAKAYAASDQYYIQATPHYI